MTKRLLILALVALAVSAGSAQASTSAQYGVQDDAWLMYGAGTLDQRVSTLQTLGVKIVRLSIRWDQVEPKKGALDWGQYGAVLDALHAAKIPAVVTIWGSPKWANGGKSANHLPKSGFGIFASQAAKRFPWIRQWTAWNEPNTRVYSTPVSPSTYVKRVLNPMVAALHAVNRNNKVAGGVTSPRKTSTSMSPLAFMQGMKAAHAKLDAYAQNPYPGSRKETPYRDPCSWCTTFNMARLSLIRSDVTRYFGSRKPVWLTEYGYQTSPPDRILGVSPALQATYLSDASAKVYRQAGVTMLIQFMVRDDTSVAGWQSGFFTAKGTAKPSFRAFQLPLAQVSRRGTRTTLWGQVRPGSGHRVYTLQRWNGHSWARVGSSMRTSANGTLQRVVTARVGQKFRIVSPVVDDASPLLRVN
jgi:hypothetical protein